MEKPQIQPPAIRTPSNRGPPKLAGVTTSRISTPVQNYITIPLGDFVPAYAKFPVKCSLVLFMLLGVHPTRYLLGRCADFDVVSRKDVPFGGPENKLFTFWPHFHQKRKFSVDFRQDLKRALRWRTSSVNTPKTTSYAFGSWMMNMQIDLYKSKYEVSLYPEVD